MRLPNPFKTNPEPIPLDLLAGYARWAENYPAEAHNPLMALEQAAMLELLPADLSDQRCLDLACGSGRYLRLLAARGATRPVGVDYSAAMLAQARRGSPGPLSCAPFAALPFAPARFDLITCALAVGHEPDLARVLSQAARLLRPGGRLLYSDFHPCGALLGWRRTFTAADGRLYRLPHHVHLYADHHRACAQAGLVIDAVREPLIGPPAPPAVHHLPAVLVIRAVKAGRPPATG